MSVNWDFKAVDRAEAHGCEALRIFTKNGNDGWKRSIQT
jgi:hypothetical protein